MASVVVVGAGLAGLSCAWRLWRAGFDVEVLEASSRPGGRISSEREHGFLLEWGSSFFTTQDHNVHSLAANLTLADSIRDLHSLPDAILRSGALEHIRPWDDPHFFNSGVVSGVAKLRLKRLRIELLRNRSNLDPAHPEIASRIEEEELGIYLRRVVGTEARDRLILPFLSASLGTDPERISSAAFLLLLTRYEGARPQYLEGGMARLINGLAESLSIRYGYEATSIETESDGARVRYRAVDREGSVVADAVVVATPGTDVPLICPKLSPSERGYFEGIRYSTEIVAHLMLDEAPALPFRSVAFPRRPGLGVAGVVASHHKIAAAPEGAGLLRVGLTEDAARRLGDATDADVGGLVLDNLSRTPIGLLSPAAIRVQRCTRAVPTFGPGTLLNYRRFLGRGERSPRLVFCGDYLLGFGGESALQSGQRAASEIAHCIAD